MEQVTPLTIGRRGPISFKVAQIDVVCADVDLLVVGMFEQDVANRPKGGADQLDRVLDGTLSRLRKGGIFNGTAGETLVLATPPAPIRARSLMLIGMGDGIAPISTAARHPAELAMCTALRMNARSAGCLLMWLERDIPAEMVEAMAATMMEGVLKAVAERARREPLPELEWTFDIRNGDAARTAQALSHSLTAAP
ncbi:M17 family peptidase N-terminal domain-containing protein [Novosphingobium sp. PP1Y]|uniref:M17 family peptidase N-terminal domain-containing protein n=1 Tax=Novosphingobium sp. PP1Y TaxID=702113 RepID=UPI00020EF8EF|nr:M17 family peptidase N-terminal domain-containing protein [Novosphingobium sp. PP1Y]CCA90767.1 peptidase M17, leucyl aminopeptidase-like [Novosphingobium sp. PP1Y]